MSNEPSIVERDAQPYVAIATRVTMDKISSVADSLPGELFGWLAARSIAPAGAPFFKYNSFHKDGRIDIEWGVPIATHIEGDGRVVANALPRGRYASVVHTGPFDGLRNATAKLFEWIKHNDLKVDVVESSDTHNFGARLEIYLTDPRQEPDSRRWETEIAIRLMLIPLTQVDQDIAWRHGPCSFPEPVPAGISRPGKLRGISRQAAMAGRIFLPPVWRQAGVASCQSSRV